MCLFVIVSNIIKWAFEIVSNCLLLIVRVRISLLTEMRLKEKDGTQRTSWRIKSCEIRTVPIWVIKASWPLGNLTYLDLSTEKLVKQEMELHMWSVAPVSTI